jgi:hypothetical protein
MREAQRALAAIAEGRPVNPPPSAPNPTLILSARRLSRRAVGAGVAALCLVVAGIVIGAMISQSPTTATAHTETRSETPNPTTQANSPCEAEFAITNSWPGHYQASVVVRSRSQPLTGWTVRWTFPDGQTIDQLWSGTLSQSGTAVTVTNAAWNATVDANGSAEFGFIATVPGGNPIQPSVICESPR